MSIVSKIDKGRLVKSFLKKMESFHRCCNQNASVFFPYQVDYPHPIFKHIFENPPTSYSTYKSAEFYHFIQGPPPDIDSLSKLHLLHFPFMNHTSLKKIEDYNGKERMFLCLASDFETKGIFLKMDSWKKFQENDKYGHCKLVIACPNIHYRSQHSEYFCMGNGFGLNLPYNYYDEGYGVDWEDINSYMSMIRLNLVDKVYNSCIDELIFYFEEYATKDEMIKSHYEHSKKKFLSNHLIEARNKQLLEIYEDR